MAYDRFMIAPFRSGLESDLTPWLLPEDAFTLLNNAYVYQGRVVKRFGSIFMNVDPLKSRLRVFLNNTNGSGVLAGMVPGTKFEVGQQFTIGDVVYTVNATGTPANMLKTDATPTATFNTSTGAYSFSGAPASTAVYWYPAQPVMGIAVYESGAITDQPSYAWDTQFVYKYVTGTGWVRETTGTPLWHGDLNQFFWTRTWRGPSAAQQYMFTTNFNVVKNGTPGVSDDPIWSYSGTTWATYTPAYRTGGYVINGAKIIMPFKGRLLLLNTVEYNAGTMVNANFVNRCRYSWEGDPFDAKAFLEQNAGGEGGGGIDAATPEAIVSAEFIKDRLIVYFENSTWELVATGDTIYPFTWQKINTELGSIGTWSTVPFDKAVLTIGSTGVNSCTGANVQRIDQKIPLQVLRFNQNSNAINHLHGIRDYQRELVYWTYVDNNRVNAPYFANSILVYNYRNNTWAINQDTFTCFGYFEQEQYLTWADADFAWEATDYTWESYDMQANTRRILAGTPEGYVVRVDPELNRNASCWQITDITSVGGQTYLKIMNHTMSKLSYNIYISGCQGTTTLNDQIFTIRAVIDDNTVSIGPVPFTGTYTGGGRAAFVSNIQIHTKELNPYIQSGRSVMVGIIDFCVQRTAQGQISVNAYPSSSWVAPNTPAFAVPDAYNGTNILETSAYPLVPFEKTQTRLWHSTYLQVGGQFVKIVLSLQAGQINNPDIAFSDFELEGIIIHCMPTSSRLA